LAPVENQKAAWGKHFDALTLFGREMRANGLQLLPFLKQFFIFYDIQYNCGLLPAIVNDESRLVNCHSNSPFLRCLVVANDRRDQRGSRQASRVVGYAEVPPFWHVRTSIPVFSCNAQKQ
jgi:hypothetical protein